MRTTLKITSKGQVTLRKEVLDQLDARPGDRIVVETVGPGRVELRRALPGASIERFIGSLRQDGEPSLSLDDIREFARRGWSGKG